MVSPTTRLPAAAPGCLRPEMRVLLDACRLDGAPPGRQGEPVDPGYLVRLAAFHRVSALVYEAGGRLDLPPEALGPLRDAALATRHRNLQAAAALKPVLRAFAAADLPVVLLKGIHLMDAVYGDPARRPLSDVDLLIRPEGLGEALAILQELGFHSDARKAAFGLSADREVKLLGSGPFTVALDLHTDLNRPARHHWFPMDALWERSVPCTFEGQPARALRPTDSLVFLCAHAVPHAFAQLIWLCDIARLAALQPVDPGALLEHARGSRALRATWAGLYLARTLLGAPIPDGMPDALEAGGGLGRRLHRWLAPERLFGSTSYSSLRSLRFRAALSDSPRDALEITAASLVHRAGEARRGLSGRKQRGEAV